MGTDNPPEQYKYPREAAEYVALPYVTFVLTNAQQLSKRFQAPARASSLQTPSISHERTTVQA
jgi:hypothetical protein